MTKETTYISNDGKRFTSEIECIKYEKEIARRHDDAVRKAAKNIDDILWKKYYPNMTETNEPELYQAFLWLENDLPAIVLRSEKKPTLEELIEEIRLAEYGDEIISKLPLDRMQSEISIRNDWANALKNVKEGSDLSCIIQWGFDPKDISELAKLHKANRFRKKIEDLLTDCNFHSECGDFSAKNYEKYIQ